jgi:hypothetical protein
MLKAIGWYVVFLVIVIGFFIGAAIIVLWHFLGIEEKEATREACVTKLQNYCYRWITEKKEPGDWDSIYPKEGCEKFNINKPSLDDCKNILK